ncbi:MAG TPA: hypothetical protein VIK22_09225 [Candidatus Anoxymicrobiaceae bacterium]|jgi:hypothetical protein
MKKLALPAVVAVSLMLAFGLALSAGCGGSKTTSSAGTSSTSGEVSEQAVGVPIYPGTKPEQVYEGVYKMTTGDSFDQVAAFYKKQLPTATYSETTIQTGKGAAFVVDESTFHGNISVEENTPSNGKVTITVSRFNTQ